MPEELKMPDGKQKGKPAKTCGANKSDGVPCGLPAGYRTDHPGYGKCVWHFGKTPMVRRAAAKEQARDLIQSFTGEILDTNPIDALLQEVSRTAGHVSWLQSRLSMWTMDTTIEMPPGQKQWLEIYQYERMHLTRAAKIAIDAGVAQRQVAIAEAQGQMLATAVQAILDGLGLSIEQKALVPDLVPRILRTVAIRTDRPQEAT